MTKQGIRKGLTDVGLKVGDVVLVHSSLSAFGYVEGGADTVIDALLETVGPEGTVVVPTFTWGPFHAAEKVILDLVNTPVKDEVGIIPEAFRKRPEAKRSTHICHSVAAIGPHSDDVMGGGVSSFGKGSNFHQLCKLDAQCVCIGVAFGCCAELHAALRGVAAVGGSGHVDVVEPSGPSRPHNMRLLLQERALGGIRRFPRPGKGVPHSKTCANEMAPYVGGHRRSHY